MSYNQINQSNNTAWPLYQLNSLMFNRNSSLAMYQMPVKESQKGKENLSKLQQSEIEKKFEKNSSSLIGTLKQTRLAENLKPVKIESQKFKRFENFNYADEYTGLSYLNNLNNNNNNHNHNNCNFSNNNSNANSIISSLQVAAEPLLNKQPKKNSEIDFRVKYKTEKCKFWEINQTCKFGEGCAFAHGTQDIRDKHFTKTTNYKTKKCKQFFENGYCSYGTRCQFLHKDNSSNNLYRLNSFSYKKSIDSLNLLTESNNNDIEITEFLNVKEINRPRLRTFEKLVRNPSQDQADNLTDDTSSCKNYCVSPNTDKNSDKDSLDKKYFENEKASNLSKDLTSSPRSRFFSC